jgi:DedD protein
VSESLKQRIVGAFVLVALAIIIIPLVFDFSGARTVDTHSQIPVMPEIQPAVVSQPTRPENITPAEPDDQMFQFGVEGTQQGEDLKDEAPSLSSEGLPVSWVLQVGSFRDKTTATELVNNLLKDDYRAFVREKKDSKGTLSRVFVGPKVLKKKLTQEKVEIDKKYGVDSLLIRFEP